jgi:hypothetical protein
MTERRNNGKTKPSTVKYSMPDLDFEIDMEPLPGFSGQAVKSEPYPAKAALIPCIEHRLAVNDNSDPSRQLEKIISAALAIEMEAAKDAGALGFMARAMVQATMPHKNIPGNEFSRNNGNFTMTMLAPSNVGLPYGSIPRLLIGYLTTEAVRTRSPHIILGNSLTAFMAELDMATTGGDSGSIGRFRNQLTRLFSCSISCSYSSGDRLALRNVAIADDANLWWQPKHPSQGALWESTVVLSQRFFDEVTHNPIPIDLRALKALKKSPMALDIYLWITYRMSYVKARTEIPWAALQLQFGSEYPLTEQGRRNFKKKFLSALAKIHILYPDIRIEEETHKLILKPSRPHILTP